jgi:Domain of unknown function (DUF1992)
MTRPRRLESVIEAQIRLAQERGEFDGLPGQGKPIPGAGEPDDELWWVKGLIKREGLPTSAMLPASLQLRKEIEDLPTAVRELPTEAAVRAAVADLNDRIVAWVRTPSGPQVPIRRVDVEQVLAGWRAGRAVLRPPAQAAPAAPAERPPRRRWWGWRPRS